MSKNLDYTDRTAERLKGSTRETYDIGAQSAGTSTAQRSASNPVKLNILLEDIAQSHHFTIHLDGFSMSKFKLPDGTYSEFLPVKSMNINYVSYENMSIPVSIFGDFPLLNKKRVTTISLSCFDMDSNLLERELRTWENRCFPKGRFVAYMDDIARKLTYKGYNVKGKQTLDYYWYVIPTGNVTVSRDYSTNDAKLVNFSLVCVGDGSTCATGNSSGTNGNSTKQEKVDPSQKKEFIPDYQFNPYTNYVGYDQENIPRS